MSDRDPEIVNTISFAVARWMGGTSREAADIELAEEIYDALNVGRCVSWRAGFGAGVADERARIRAAIEELDATHHYQDTDFLMDVLYGDLVLGGSSSPLTPGAGDAMQAPKNGHPGSPSDRRPPT